MTIAVAKMSRSFFIGYCAPVVPRGPSSSTRLNRCSCRGAAAPAPARPCAFSAASFFCGDISNFSSCRSPIWASCSSPIRSGRFDFGASGGFLLRLVRFCSERRVVSKSRLGGLEGESYRDIPPESEAGGEKSAGKSRLVEEKRLAVTTVVAEAAASTRMDMLDLEKQFSFYGAYHSNKVNVFIHTLFVWPIFYTSLILLAYAAPFAPLPFPAGTLPLQEYMVLNLSFVQAAIYGLYYIALDKKAGSIGALMCLGCWIGANVVAQALPWSLSWKIVLASQVTCWFFQVFGHVKFEGRAPALLDNLPQAFLMAPFFVLLECLQTAGYEPYPGFQKNVQKNVDDAIRDFRQSKAKKAA